MLIVAYLLYRLYKLLEGSIAVNIVVGIGTLYLISYIVGLLNLEMLDRILQQFLNLGVIILIIIFQPEVRRFLLLLGNTTIRNRSTFFNRLINPDGEIAEGRDACAEQIWNAMLQMSKEKTGALIVLTGGQNMDGVSSSGTVINARVSRTLLETIFNKHTPLHDGAVLIGDQLILEAGCVLPVSDSQRLPRNAGLRHRAAVGVTERANVAAFVVSEETGLMSMAHEGRLTRGLSEEKLLELLNAHVG